MSGLPARARRLWEEPLRWMGGLLAGYLNQPTRGYRTFAAHDAATLASVLRPADVLLVEGDLRVSTAIKFLTQSTWSHAALYVGTALQPPAREAAAGLLVEADMVAGVIAVPVSKYARHNIRICRPVGLTDEDRARVVGFMTRSLGMTYDLRNIVDLVRYLLPTPPVPSRLRRRMIALGSGDPTRAICSTLIARAFQEVRYPILPDVESPSTPPPAGMEVRDILHIRHHSLFTPRDFDLSPYFRVIKPTLERGFDYRRLLWSDRLIELPGSGGP